MPALPFVDDPNGSQSWAPGNVDGASGAGTDPAPQGLAGSLMGGQQTPVGTGDLTADYNTPLHVGGLILVGLGIIIFLKVAGFRFNVDAGVGL